VIRGETQEFAVLAQIRKFCESRDGCQKFTAVLTTNDKDSDSLATR